MNIKNSLDFIPIEIKRIIDKNNKLKNDSVYEPIVKVGSKNKFNIYLKGNEDFITVIIGLIISISCFFYLVLLILNEIQRAIDGEDNAILTLVLFNILLFILLFGMVTMYTIIFMPHEQSDVKKIFFISELKNINTNEIKILHNNTNIDFSIEKIEEYHLDLSDNPLNIIILHTECLKLKNMTQYSIEIENTKIDFTFIHWHPTKRRIRFQPDKLIIEKTTEDNKYTSVVIEGIIDGSNKLRNYSVLLPFIKVGSNAKFNVYLRKHEDFISGIFGLIIFVIGSPVIVLLILHEMLKIIAGENDIIFIIIIYFFMLIAILFTIFTLCITLFVPREYSNVKYIVFISKFQQLNFNQIKILQNDTHIDFSIEKIEEYYLNRSDKPLNIIILYTEDLKLKNMKQYTVEIENNRIGFNFTHSHPTKWWQRFHPNQLIIEEIM